MNAHETAARLFKVLALTNALDAALAINLKMDPFSPAAFEEVAALSDAGWAVAAKSAGVNPPSATTRSHVIELYAKRLEVRRAMRVG